MQWWLDDIGKNYLKSERPSFDFALQKCPKGGNRRQNMKRYIQIRQTTAVN